MSSLALFVLLAACQDYELVGTADPPATGQTPEETLSPVLRVEPLHIDFGSLERGESSSAVVTVANDGPGDLWLEAIEIDDAEGPFSIGEIPSEQLGPNTSTLITVSYLPTSDSAALGSLWVHASDQPSSEVVLEGDVLRPLLVMEPLNHDFGSLSTGEADLVDIAVRNEGAGTLRIDDLTYSASSPSEMWVVDAGGLEAGAILAPGDATAVQIVYAPQDDVADEGTLRLLSNDPVLPDLTATQVGTGEAVTAYDVEIALTADDSWEGWLDGVALSSSGGASWTSSDTFSIVLDSGDHVLAVHAWDVAQVIAGLIGAVWVDGSAYRVTGDGSWLLTASSPASNWNELGFSSAGWMPPSICSDPSPWGTSYTGDLLAEGASWVWWTSDCRALGEAWFRLEFSLP